MSSGISKNPKQTLKRRRAAFALRKNSAKHSPRIAGYLAGAIHSFVGDPADSPFQRGYLAALKEVQRMVHDFTTQK